METIVGLAGLWLFLQVVGPILLFALVVYAVYRFMRRDEGVTRTDRHEFASAEPPERHEFTASQPTVTPHPEVPYRPDLGYHPENEPGPSLLDSHGRPIHHLDDRDR